MNFASNNKFKDRINNNNKFNSKNYKSLDQINLIRQHKFDSNSRSIEMDSNNLTSSYFKELYLKLFSSNSFIKKACSNAKLNDKKIMENHQWYV